MPDKKYKELSKRLNSKSKHNSGGNFRSYERISQDTKRDSEVRRSERPGSDAGYTSKSGSNRNFLKKLTITALPFIAAIVLIVIGVYTFTIKNSTEIKVNGDAVGQIKTTKLTKEEFMTTLTSIITQLEETKILITDDIELTLVRGKSKLLKDESQLLNLLAEIVTYKVLAAEITVDGQKVGVAKNRAEAEKILNAVKQPYLTSEKMTASFVQNVEVVEIYVAKDEIISNDTIRAEMQKTSTSTIEYIVVAGDNLSKIAALNGITVNDIKDMNPGLEVDKLLQTGTKLSLESTVPFVSVITIEESVETAEIPMGTVEQQDSSLQSGQRRILQQGKAGKKEITTQITRVNGLITSRGEASEKILEPAVSQVVAVGTG